jgi:hypothetical protein
MSELFAGFTGQLADLISRYPLWFLGGLLLLLALQTLRLFVQKTAAGRRVAGHRRLGADGERRARTLLKKEGYRIQAEQSSGTYSLLVDGQRVPVRLRADFIVERRGRVYVAEVKSGEESVKVTGRATRRQLLEYLFAFDVHGVLLLDMHESCIREVNFPPLKGR